MRRLAAPALRQRRPVARVAVCGALLLSIAAVAAVLLRPAPRAKATPEPWARPAGVRLAPPAHRGVRAAAAAAHCRLTVTRGHATDAALRHPELPPTIGPPVPEAAPAGAYGGPLPLSQEIGALRAGLVIVAFRPRLPRDDVRLLRAVYDADPRVTVLVAKAPERRFAVTATAWRRRLSCPEFGPNVIDAVRLFRRRYAGRGPHSG
jgi:uncharacterized protein DUF3105